MSTRVFISEQPKTKTSRKGDVLVHLAVYVNSSINQCEITNLTPEQSEKGKSTITFSVKEVNAGKIESITAEQIIKTTNSAEINTLSNEQYVVDLTKVTVPVITLKNFENSDQMQEWLNGYYLQTALNENKDFNVQNWIEKK